MLDSGFAFSKLIDPARAGCDESQGVLLERYRKYLKTLARVQIYRSLNSKLDASDVVQETIIRACSQLPEFRGHSEEQFQAWLRTILASRLSKLLRYHLADRRTPQREQQLGDSLAQSSERLVNVAVSPGKSPSELVSSQETAVLVASAIEDLPEDYRTIILLRHVQGLPYGDVAAHMNRTENAVKKLWVRALICLRRSVEDVP